MTDAMNRITVLATAFARLSQQFAEVCNQMQMPAQPASAADPTAIDEAVARHMNDSAFIKKVAPFVAQEIDVSDLEIDSELISDAVADQIDWQDVKDSIVDAVDTSEIAQIVADNYDSAELVRHIDLDHVAAALVQDSTRVSQLTRLIVAEAYAEQLSERDATIASLREQLKQAQQAQKEAGTV